MGMRQSYGMLSGSLSTSTMKAEETSVAQNKVGSGGTTSRICDGLCWGEVRRWHQSLILAWESGVRIMWPQNYSTEFRCKKRSLNH